MGETNVESPSSSASAKNKPTTIFIPPRGPMDSLFTNGLSGVGFSPGPMTLVSSYFTEQSPFSFSQLLSMASPKPADFLLDGDNSNNNNNNDVEGDLGVKGEGVVGEEKSDEGYKRNRPVNLVVNQSPKIQLEGLNQLFMVPPGLSPGGLLNSPGFLSPLQSPFGMSHQQALAHVTAQAAFSQSYIQMQAELQRSSTVPSQPETSTHPANPSPSEPESSKIESPEFSESDKKPTTYVSGGNKPATDGYNWRKYGQKHVKASECPRSYYKCTYINCPVKKKVERSADGHVSEIIYKGNHNHDPPQPNKRGRDSGVSEKTGVSQRHIEAADRAKEIDFVNSDPGNLIQHHSNAGNNRERERSTIVVDDDEPVAKRRGVDMMGPTVPVSSSHQTVTESKIVVQTRSEVDLLDDGFKWRKYGQKVVKGNPYPRSYYRCTYAGCNVRKHVERSAVDPKAVVTTYEGKHSHEIPVGKYNAQQQLKSHKNVTSKNPSSMMSSRETDFESKDQIPITLQLKQEHVSA